MILEGRIALQAPVQGVWDLLQDMPRVARCLPGCEGLTPLGTDAWKATARSKVGPVSVAFQGDLRVRERAPLERMALHFEGRDSRTASQVRVLVGLRLEPQGADATSLAYQADVLLTGRLGQMGQSVVRETAAVLLEEFVRCIRRDLLQTPLARPEGPPAQAAPSTSFQLRLAGHLVQGLLLGAVHRMRALWRR